MSVTTYNVDAGKDRATIELIGETKVVFSFDPNIIAVEAVSGEVNVSLDEGATAGDDGCDTLSEGQSTRMNPIADKCIYVNGTGTVKVWGGRSGEDCPFPKSGKGGGSGGGINDYTTTERKIGKWIDGSDLYQRTFEVTASRVDGWNDNSLGTSGIKIVDVQGFMYGWYEDAYIYKPLVYFRSTTDFITVIYDDDVNVYIMDPGVSTSQMPTLTITIKYTKLPEQANLMQAAPTEEVSETPTVEEDDMR